MLVELKVGDTKPVVKYPLWDEDGDPIDAEELDAIKFSMAAKDGSAIITDDTANTSVIQDKTALDENGEEIKNWVQYEWQTGDTDTAGRYYAEFEIEDGSEVQHFPKDASQNIQVQIDQELA